MANLPTNDSYQGTGSAPKGQPISFTPSTTYQNLANLRASGGSPFAPTPTPIPNTPEYYTAKQAGVSQYGRLLNNGLGVNTQTSFLPPEDPNAMIPLPPDYGEFAAPMAINSNGEKLSWGTPTSPVIRTVQGDALGQYVEDTANPDLLVKTVRGRNDFADNAIRNGRPGFMYQIDHIMPLNLGGADTLANRQLLTADQNDQKTRAQAIPYTLYAHGDISLSEARQMAMQWKDRDLTDIPQPNEVGLVSDMSGKSGIEIAREAAARWKLPKERTTKDKLADLPETMKNFGKSWLPAPIRNFVTGAASSASFGFLPDGSDEESMAGDIGMVFGGIGSFLLGGALLKGALVLGGAARGSLAAWRGVALAKATEAGFETAAAVNAGRAAETTFASLNKAPSYLKKLLTPDRLRQAGFFGATSALVGQAHQFVENHFNPGVLSGQAYETEQENMIGNIFKDLAIGAVSGIGSPTIKGTAYAVMLPTTLSYLANPDDPVEAITQGVIFGALHGLGSYKNPRFNDVKMLGGKPYESPVVKAFEETANKAAYESLRHYAPDIYPGLKPGERVPASAHNEATVQAAKDKAIENVWKRFFFGKDAPEATQTKTLEDFKGFSTNLNTALDAPATPALTGLSKFSAAARKEKAAAEKAQTETIREEFGVGYQSRNKPPKGTELLEGEGMDLQTALTEIKRITVASRQLYKGGLTGDLRNKADVDDLLSFGKSNLQNRFSEQERFVNPPIAKQAVDAIDESFMKNSFNNEKYNPESQLPNGDMALTGAALGMNKAKADYFFDQLSVGQASRNILLIDRADTAPLWRMKNDLLDQADIKASKYARDPNPDQALQAFGVVINKKTGQKELVPLGWVASDFRLNTATGEGHTAYNQHELVKRYKETGGTEGMRPLDLHKDQIVPKMREQGIRVLVANLDLRATKATMQSGNPFIPLNLKDANWKYSKDLGDRLLQLDNRNPISMDIAQVASALGAKQKTEAIAQMKKNRVPSAAELIPHTAAAVEDAANKAILAQETTRNIVHTVEESLDVASPAQVKTAFKRNLDMDVSDAEAAQIFNERNNMTMREGVQLLVDAKNEGRLGVAGQIKLEETKAYIESGALQQSDAGKVALDMPIIGKLRNVTALSGKESQSVSPEVQTNPASERGAPVEAVAPPVAPEPVVKAPEPVAPLVQAKLPLAERVVARRTRSEKANKLKTSAEELYSRIKNQIDDIDVLGGGQFKAKDADAVEIAPEFDTSMANMNPESAAIKFATRLLQVGRRFEPINVSPDEAAAIKRAVYPQIERDVIIKLRDHFGVPQENAEAIVRGIGERSSKAAAEKAATPPAAPGDFFKSDLEKVVGKDSPILNDLKRQYPQLSKSEYDILYKKREDAARGLFAWIEKGKTQDPGSYSHAFSWALDTSLKKVVGPDYMSDPKMRQLLGRAFGNEGKTARRWSKLAETGEVKKDMKELTQPKDNLLALGLGNRAAKAEAEARRIKDMETNPSGGVSPDEMKAVSGDASEPMRYDEENMIKGLARGDTQLLPGLSSITLAGAEERGVAASRRGVEDARGVLQFIVGANNEAAASANKARGYDQSKLQPKLYLTGIKRNDWYSLNEKQKKEVNDKTDEFFDNLHKDYVNSYKVADEVAPTETIAPDEAQAELSKLKVLLERLQKSLKNDPEDPPATWETPEILQTRLKEVTDRMKVLSKVLDKPVDGSGGPGFFGGFMSKLKDLKDRSYLIDPAYAAPPRVAGASIPAESLPPTQPREPNLRGLPVNDSDLKETAHILYGEISNRDPEDQKKEITHIINTAVNRAKDNPAGYGTSIVKVLQKPNQYQSYAPKGITVKGGKVVESQYQKVKAGKLDEAGQKKLQLIMDTLNEMKQKDMEDSTGGAMFYVHASDGTLWVGQTIQEAKNYALDHERKLGLRKTQFGTSEGLPAR